MNSLVAKEVVIRAWKIFKTRDVRLIAELFTPDAGWSAMAGSATAVALKHANHMIGPNQIAQLIAFERRHLFSNIDISFFGIHADTVIVEERTLAILPGG